MRNWNDDIKFTEQWMVRNFSGGVSIIRRTAQQPSSAACLLDARAEFTHAPQHAVAFNVSASRSAEMKSEEAADTEPGNGSDKNAYRHAAPSGLLKTRQQQTRYPARECGPEDEETNPDKARNDLAGTGRLCNQPPHPDHH